MRYLSNECTLGEFRDWFDDETWGLAADTDSPLRQLAGEIELRIAEFTNGHLAEADLRRQLEDRLFEYDFQVPVMNIEPSVEMTLL